VSQMRLAYETLRDLILTLELAPGERLSERWLETQFEGSRTPIRAALVRLETEGLIQREGRSYVVAPIQLGEIEHVFAFRETVEIGAARLACECATPADIDVLIEMLDSCRPETPREEWHRVGNEFHVELARLSGNPFFARSVDDIMTRLSRARWMEIWNEGARDRAWQEHRQILELLRARKPDEAAAAISSHIRGSRSRLLTSVSENRRGLRARGFAVVG
jgi:DNA-binding GntR family transcriptional regulator